MASKLLKIGFIGGGKMAQAMAKGFISAGQFTIDIEAYLKKKTLLIPVGSNQKYKYLQLLVPIFCQLVKKMII